MATVVRETLGEQGWPGGVHRATDPALSSALAGSLGRNSALALADAGVPYVMKRRGMSCLNTDGATAFNNTHLIGQYEYTKVSTGDRFHLTAGKDGRLVSRGAGDLFTVITSTGLTAGEFYPSFTAASDLCFLVNGRVQKKFDGVALTGFGITRPTVGTLAGAAGVAGSPNGTYELRVTFGNSATGHESSASNTAVTTVVLASQKLGWTGIPVSSDVQVDKVYLYVRNMSTQRQFYRAGEVANGTTTATTDTLDANLTTVAPSTIGSDPPPTTAKYLAYHQGRMFVATDTALFYTTPLHPEAFDLTNRVETFVDGQRLTGIYSDREVLLIFKEDRTYVLRGSDPNTWSIDLLDARIGCAAHRTIKSADDGRLYWWARQGLVRWDGLGAAVDAIGRRTYGPPDDTIFYAEIARASAAFDTVQGRLLIAVPGIGQSRANLILPFNTALGVFEADYWDPMDCASLGTAHDAIGVERVYLGNYNGQIFSLWTAENDGVVTGTHTGTFTHTTGSLAGVVDTGATFDTVGERLAERHVTLVDSNGVKVPIFPRPRIASNSGTTILFDQTQDWFTAHPGETFTYIIGGPDFEWETPDRTAGAPWLRKRFEYLFLLYKGVISGVAARVNLRLSYHTGAADRSVSFTTSSTGALWDSGTWDTSVWDTPTTPQERWRVGDIGWAWKARVQNPYANQPFGLLYVGVQAVVQGTAK